MALNWVPYHTDTRYTGRIEAQPDKDLLSAVLILLLQTMLQHHLYYLMNTEELTGQEKEIKSEDHNLFPFIGLF